MATILEEKKAHYRKQIREATDALARLERLEKNFIAMVDSFETHEDLEWALASLINSAVEHGMPLGEGFDW
ncbi:uncharacterized protein J3D65DRAFT_670785 [Phyllosticta citribraziliensis]|uniref:Uncharacterized protein n=1 Tax=Phyllosticta citribraziliensis TaxID=989973 RepID=A0ABR1LC09_9PEZI